MRTKKIRIYWLLSVVLIFVLGMTGCREKNIAATQGETDSRKSGETLTMVWPYLTKVSPGLSEVEQAVSEITEREIGVSIHLAPLQMFSSISEVSYAVKEGKPMDLCVSIFQGLDRFVNEDVILPLDELVKQTNLEEICGVQLTGGYYRNQLYGIPVVFANGRRRGFICRTDLLEKYGITIDKNRYYTFEELEDICETVKQGEGEDFYCVTPKGFSQAQNVLCLYDALGTTASSGVLMLEEDNSDRIVNLYGTESYFTYAQKAYEWAQKGYIEPDAYINQTESDTAVREGGYFGFFLDDVTEQEGEYTARTGRSMTYIPMGEPWMQTGSYQSAIWCVTKSCSNPEKAMEFLNLLFTDEELINLLQYGIEGESFEIEKSDEKGTVIRLPEGKGVQDLPYYTELGIYGDRLKAYIWAPGDTDRNQNIKKFSDGVEHRSPALGYVFDVGDLEIVNARVRKVQEQYEGLIAAGIVDPAEEIPKFLEALEEAGIQELLAENQRQYEEK